MNPSKSVPCPATPPPPRIWGSAVRRLATFAAALALTGLATPAIAAKEWGQGACRAESGDNRTTRWTSQIIATGSQIDRSSTNSHTHNQIWLDVGILAASTFGGQYPVGAVGDSPRLVKIAVMGNDAKAGTVVWGQDVGTLGTDLSTSHRFTGLKPNTHYVAVLYSPYLGYGNLNPLARYCFRTDRDPANPYGGSGTGCFAPYTPTVGGTRQSANYTACVQARNACNAASNTTWEQAGNRCIPASN